MFRFWTVEDPSKTRIGSNFKRLFVIQFSMAWRFGSYRFVKQGILDNTQLGRTRGEIEFADVGRVILNLQGDMQGNLLNRKIHFNNPDYDPEYIFDHGGGGTSTAGVYMRDFDIKQIGQVGDIFGEPYLYIEWYSDSNGRCVIELSEDSFQSY